MRAAGAFLDLEFGAAQTVTQGTTDSKNSGIAHFNKYRLLLGLCSLAQLLLGEEAAACVISIFRGFGDYLVNVAVKAGTGKGFMSRTVLQYLSAVFTSVKARFPNSDIWASATLDKPDPKTKSEGWYTDFRGTIGFADTPRSVLD